MAFFPKSKQILYKRHQLTRMGGVEMFGFLGVFSGFSRADISTGSFAVRCAGRLTFFPVSQYICNWKGTATC